METNLIQQQTDALTKEFKKQIEALVEQNAELNQRLVATAEKLNTLRAQSSQSSHAREAEKIPIKTLPKNAEFERWRMSVHAAVVAASSDQ